MPGSVYSSCGNVYEYIGCENNLSALHRLCLHALAMVLRKNGRLLWPFGEAMTHSLEDVHRWDSPPERDEDEIREREAEELARDDERLHERYDRDRLRRKRE